MLTLKEYFRKHFEALIQEFSSAQVFPSSSTVWRPTYPMCQVIW